MGKFGLLSVLLYLIALVLEFIFSVKITDIRGISLKNISFYLLLCASIIKYINNLTKSTESKKIYSAVFVFLLYSFIIILYKFMINNGSISDITSVLFSFKNFTEPFLVLICVLILIDKKDNILFLIDFLLLIFILSNLVTLLGGFGLIDFSRSSMSDHWGRVDGALGEPNLYASYIVIFIPLLLNRFFYSKNTYKKIYFSCSFFLGIYCLFFTGSRGGFFALFLGIIYLYYISKKNITNVGIVKKLFLLFLLILSVGSLYSFLPNTSKEGLGRNVVSRFDAEDLDGYSSGRIQLWTSAMKLFIEHPFCGINQSFRKFSHHGTHNEFLSQLLHKGLIGLVMYLLIFFVIYKKIFSKYTLNSDYKTYYSGYLAGLLSFFVSMFFVDMYTPIYFFFIFSALLYNL